MGGLSKDKLRQVLAKIFRLRSWKLALILILLGFWAATLLRFDHIRMTELRDAVLAADGEDDDAKIAESLKELQSFTIKHIIFNAIEENGGQRIVFGTGPFYLENQYLRKAQEAVKKAQEEIDKKSKNPNGNVYQKVAEICDAQGKKYGWRYPDKEYINCWINELATFPVTDNMDAYGAANLPSTELFRYEFASPVWYPCGSGIIILLCIILVIALIIRFFIWIFLKLAVAFVSHPRK